MEKVNIVFTDDNNNFYGILMVYSGYSEKVIRLRLEDIIISMFGSSKKFFENFSENLSKVLEVFGKEVVENCRSRTPLEDKAIVQFEYNNGSMFNVDKVFNVLNDREGCYFE